MGVVWTKGPRIHGWTGCRSLEVWSLDRRQSVSRPSPFQANLHHRNGTGSLWCWVGGRSDGGCVTSEWPLERRGGVLVGARVVRLEGEGPAKGTGGLADWHRWQPGRWDEWTGNTIASKLNWNWIWELQLLLGLGGPSLGLGVGSLQCTRRDRGPGEEEHGWWTAGDQTQHERKHRRCTGPDGRWRRARWAAVTLSLSLCLWVQRCLYHKHSSVTRYLLSRTQPSLSLLFSFPPQ